MCTQLYTHILWHIPIKRCKVSMFACREINKPRFSAALLSAAGGDERQHRWMERLPRRSRFGHWKLGRSISWDAPSKLFSLVVWDLYFEIFCVQHIRSWTPLTIWCNLMLIREVSSTTSARTKLYLPSCILQLCLRGAIQLNSHAMMAPWKLLCNQHLGTKRKKARMKDATCRSSTRSV